MNRILLCAALLLALSGCGEDYGLDQKGEPVAAERLEGHWLVVNYWAEWCGPCRSEIPELNQLAAQAPEGVTLVGVNYDGLEGDELLQSAQALGIEFLVLQSDPAERYGLPRANVLPSTYIVDPRGRLREQLVGEQNAAGLREVLLRLQKEKRS